MMWSPVEKQYGVSWTFDSTEHIDLFAARHLIIKFSDLSRYAFILEIGSWYLFLLSCLLFLFFSRLHNFFLLSSCLLCRSEMSRGKSVIRLLSCCITSIFSWSSILEEMLFIFIFNSSIYFLLSAKDGGPSCPHKLTSRRFSP